MMTNSGLCNRNENILLLTAVNHWQVINYFFLSIHILIFKGLLTEIRVNNIFVDFNKNKKTLGVIAQQ